MPTDPVHFWERQRAASNLLRQRIRAANGRFNARRYFHRQVDDNGFVQLQPIPHDQAQQNRTEYERILHLRNQLEIRTERLRILRLQINK